MPSAEQESLLLCEDDQPAIQKYMQQTPNPSMLKIIKSPYRSCNPIRILPAGQRMHS